MGEKNAQLDPAVIDDRIQDLLEQQLAITAASNERKLALDSDGHKWTKEDLDAFDESALEYDRLEAEIQRRAKLNAQTIQQEAGMGRQTDPDDVPPVSLGVQATPAERRKLPAQPVDETVRGRAGFRNFGEFGLAVMRGGRGGNIDPRLLTAPTATGNTGVGADGGFLVPPDFRETIMTKVLAEDTLAGMTDQQTTSSNRFTMPADEVTPWDTTTGPQAEWIGEGKKITQSKPSLRQLTVGLGKLSALVPVTEEQLEDGPSITRYLNTKVPDKFSAAITEAIINGTGVASPLGILSAPDLITVAKETVPAAQSADTIVAGNINQMYNRMFSQFRGGAVWIANQDIEPQLDLLVFNVLNAAKTDVVGGTPLFIPPGGISAQPFATLKAKRMIFSQSAKTLGDAGDILFWDPSQYITVTKTSGMRADTSIHMFFDFDVTAFPFIFRFGGRPKWASTIAARNGTATYGSVVQLAERA